MAIGIVSAKAGAIIGTTIGGPVDAVVGAAGGFIVDSIGAVVFDYLNDNNSGGIKEIGKTIDNAIDNTVKTVKNVAKNDGNAVSGFFSDLGKAFARKESYERDNYFMSFRSK